MLEEWQTSLTCEVERPEGNSLILLSAPSVHQALNAITTCYIAELVKAEMFSNVKKCW